MATIELVSESRIRKVSSWNNGSSPWWGSGSKMIVRTDDDALWVSINDVDPEAQKWCNTRRHLYRSTDGGKTWECVHAVEEAEEREPCPLVAQVGGHVIVSSNRGIEMREYHGNGNHRYLCQPTLFDYGPEKPGAPSETIPAWRKPYYFFDHSYRAFGADTEGNFFLHHHARYENIHYIFPYLHRDNLGVWRAGELKYPIRGCYPAVAVRGRAVAVVAISDEEEPVKAWREYKNEVAKEGSDLFDFRNLFFTWTPDIDTTAFSPVLTFASRDETDGRLHHTDILQDDGGIWCLYMDRSHVQPYMRDKFFPKMPMSIALRLVHIKWGKVVERRTIVAAEDTPGVYTESGGVKYNGTVPGWAGFHRTADGKPWIVWTQQGEPAVSGMFATPLVPEGAPAPTPIRVPLTEGIGRFDLASERAGCSPSDTLDILSTVADGMMWHARVRFRP